MNKALFFKTNGKEFGLTSVVVPAGTKGFIYLEAMNEPAVRSAINGLRGVRHKFFFFTVCGFCGEVTAGRRTNQSPSRGLYIRIMCKVKGGVHLKRFAKYTVVSVQLRPDVLALRIAQVFVNNASNRNSL